MSREKLPKQVIGLTLVIVALVGCVVPAATPVSEAPAVVSTPEPAAATSALEQSAVTSTPEPPTSTPEPTETPLPTPTETPLPTPTETPLPTPTPTPSTPSYSTVLGMYPSEAEICDSAIDVVEFYPDGKLGVILPAGIPIVQLSETDLRLDYPLNCYGVQVTLKVEATIDGTSYPAGTLLTLHPDSSPPPIPKYQSQEPYVKIFTNEPTEGKWDVPTDMIWIEVSSWD